MNEQKEALINIIWLHIGCSMDANKRQMLSQVKRSHGKTTVITSFVALVVFFKRVLEAYNALRVQRM